MYYTLECEINADLYHANLIVNFNCLCGYLNENAEHYLLHCNSVTVTRIIMLFEINKLNLIGIPINIDLLLLFGNETLSCDVNCSIFLAGQKYIKDTFLCHARASSNYSDFLKRHLYLRNRLLDHGYKKIRFIRSLKKFIFRYQDLVEIYSVSAETIINDGFSYSENV